MEESSSQKETAASSQVPTLPEKIAQTAGEDPLEDGTDPSIPPPPANPDSLRAAILDAYVFPEIFAGDSLLVSAIKTLLQSRKDYLLEVGVFNWATYDYAVLDDLFLMLYSTDHRNPAYGMMYDINLAIFLKEGDHYRVLADSSVGGRYSHVVFLEDWYWSNQDSLYFYFEKGFHEEVDTMIISLPVPEKQ
ncbi:MAG: hypothetical protein AAF587_26080 [Bacteroidota bacterium]